jgi:hypothetical protein
VWLRDGADLVHHDELLVVRPEERRCAADVVGVPQHLTALLLLVQARAVALWLPRDARTRRSDETRLHTCACPVLRVLQGRALAHHPGAICATWRSMRSGGACV